MRDFVEEKEVDSLWEIELYFSAEIGLEGLGILNFLGDGNREKILSMRTFVAEKGAENFWGGNLIYPFNILSLFVISSTPLKGYATAHRFRFIELNIAVFFCFPLGKRKNVAQADESVCLNKIRYTLFLYVDRGLLFYKGARDSDV